MSFDERLGYLLLGMALGYIIRTLQDIKKEGREVRKLLKEEKDESGFMRYPLIADITLILVVVMCVYASFSTQITNNRLEETQKRLGEITVCNTHYLVAQADFLSIYLEDPPPSMANQKIALQRYLDTLEQFTTVNENLSSLNKETKLKVILDSSLEECLRILD